MGYVLARAQQTFITRLVKAGRFRNQSEAVREAIRRVQRQETDYLTPPGRDPRSGGGDLRPGGSAGQPGRPGRLQGVARGRPQRSQIVTAWEVDEADLGWGVQSVEGEVGKHWGHIAPLALHGMKLPGGLGW